MIEQIFYLNLDRSSKRNEWFLEHMEKAGVPMEIVERIPAKDWKDYDGVEDMLSQMNQEDGFAQHFCPDLYKEKLQRKWLGRTAYAWTYSKILKRLIGTDGASLIMHDDYSIVSWDDLVSAINTIPWFHILQLDFHCHKVIPRNACLPYNEIWNRGIQSFGEGMVVYNKEGISRMLSLIQGTHEGLRMIEDVMYHHFNSHWAFHPVMPDRFRTSMDEEGVHKPRDIMPEDLQDT